MKLLFVLKPAWIVLLLCLVHHTKQTSQNGIEGTIVRLQDLIIGKFTDLESLIKNDIKPKLEQLEVKLKKIESQIDNIESQLNVSDQNKCTPTSGIPRSSLPWHTIGDDHFVRFAENVTWYNARELCQENCLDLLKPNDGVAVASYLEQSFNDTHHWLGGHGNGSQQVWVSTGGSINRTEPWASSSDYKKVETDQCLAALTYGGFPEAHRILQTKSCKDYNFPALCG